MKTLTLLVALLFAPAWAAAQEPDAPEGSRITVTQVSGFDADRLSPGLRKDLDALTGTALDWGVVGELATRIETERPDTVVATRAIRTAEGEARVVFLVARVTENRGLRDNINDRYTIEEVRLDGIEDDRVSAALRQDLQGLVGGRLDSRAVARLLERLRAELSGFEVRRRVSRGSRRGQLRLIFEIREGDVPRLIPFAPDRSKLLFHSEQGWSALFDLQIGHRSFRVSPIFAFGNADDLVEEYSAAGVRVEHRGLGTEHLGVRLELARYSSEWRSATEAALAFRGDVPDRYRSRTTFAPSLLFGVSPQIDASIGVSTSELEPEDRGLDRQMASAFTASLGYHNRWVQREASHRFEAGMTLRTTADSLRTDLDYKRVAATARYDYERGRTLLLVTGQAGHLTGRAPLFERFTLGDSTTLRGWDKYDIAPAGAASMLHGSIEYRQRGVAFFLDAGSAWDRQTARALRLSTGVGYHGENAFLTLGLPLNSDDLRAMVMFGARF